MARRARALTESEAAEWASYVHRIRPLRDRRAGTPSKAPAMAPSKAMPADRPTDVPIDLPAAKPVRPLTIVAVRSGQPTPLGIGGQPAGVDAASWQRFRRGRMYRARKLDLHGMTAQHAFHALRSFLRAAHADSVRCVEIVTGRGGPDGGVLRRELPLWLNLPDIRPLVLAAVHPHSSSAPHSHIANQGSVRLLLRRPRV
jgi:DNA-nicking Smr family endonuclease